MSSPSLPLRAGGVLRRLISTRRPLNNLAVEVESSEDTAFAPYLQGPYDKLNQWSSSKTKLLSPQSFADLLANRVPDVRQPSFLSKSECASLVDIIKTHQIGSYGANVFPPIGTVGITQFGHQQDKEGYLAKVAAAKALQTRFRNEANVDVIGRVADILRHTTGLPVRIARENGREYFAGLLRLIDKSALLHADYGPYDGPSWEIGQLCSQVTWNILLKQVVGGEAAVYNRPWRGSADDVRYKQTPPSYGYSRQLVEGIESKVIRYQEGDLHFFNSRNFHEVKALNQSQGTSRYTMTSFVGLLPASGSNGPSLIMWS